jgi:iron complex outermembrane recepter protein
MINTPPPLGLSHRVFRACAFLILAAISFFNGSLFAQTAQFGSIEGRIKHAVSGDYLNNVRVSVVGTNLVALTDEAGLYRLEGVPVGSVAIKVFHSGLDEQQITVTVVAGQAAQQNITLTNKSRFGEYDETVLLDTFVVQSSKETNAQAIAVNEQRFSRTQKSVVSADQFGTIADSNPGELMKWLPGVSVEYFANNITAVSVRGLDAASTEIQFDGMPMASASTSSTGRGFEMMGASASDISRVEVRKLRTPETSANALGGSLNLIRKSAFEASKASLSYKVGLTTDFESFDFDKRPGVRDTLILGWRPNSQLTWTHPVSKKFGYVITIGHEDVLARVHWSSPSRNYGNLANAVAAKARIDAGLSLTTPSVYNPARTQDLLHDNPKQDIKDYASVKLDWRPVPELKLSYSLNGSIYQEKTGDDLRVTWATGTTVYNDQHTTLGAAGTGAFQYDMREAWRNGTKPVFNQVISGEWRKGDWTLGAKGSYSVSKQTFKDTEDGFFSGTTMPGSSLPNMGIGVGKANPRLITLDLLDQSYSFSRRIEARDNVTGAPIDLTDLSNLYIGGAVSRPGKIIETIAAVRLYAERAFGFHNPLSVKVGFDYDELYRNRQRYDANIWTFVGADGLAGTADDNAAQIKAVNTQPERDSFYDSPPVGRVSMSRLYDLYVAHPGWFAYRAGESYRFSVQDPYEINEKTYAPYFQFTGTLLNNRLSYIGGVRYERAEAWGLGLKDNGGAAITGTSTLAQAQARYQRKGARGEGSNDGYFPSLESSYNITENLILRAGYAKTQAKNRFDRSVIPNNAITPAGTGTPARITFRNPNLTPWTANNYEAHLEYYTSQGGVIGVGAFRKNISNNQVTRTVLMDTPELVAAFGLEPEYLGYDAVTWVNEGVGRLDGVEFETRQPLDVILPGFARGFVFTGSFNYNNLAKFNYENGNISTDFQNFYETQIKGSMSYRRGRFGASAGFIRNGRVYRQRDDVSQTISGVRHLIGEGHRYYPPYTTVDFSLDYALNKWAKISISGRNVTNAHKTRIREVQNAPAWSQLHIENNLGVTYTVGLSGTF